MENIRRPYTSLSIEDLEATFESQPSDFPVLSQLAQELSHRRTKRARNLLALVAARLAEFESEPDEPDLNGLEDTPNDDDASSDEEVSRAPKQERSITAVHSNAANSDQPPDDRRRPHALTRIRPVGTPGLPAAWVRPLQADRKLSVGVDADLSDVYIAALTALIAEIKTTGAGQKRYELENGARVEGNECVYEFPFTDDAELFEDAKVEIIVSGRRVDGSIVSIGSGRIWLATGEDFGRTLQRVILLVDATALLEALKQRIEDTRTGQIALNRSIADAAVGRKPPPTDGTSIPAGIVRSKLNSAQGKAHQRALSASVSYIWGPPGCGKTFVLGEIVRSAFEANKRILICSNTNKAVDQVVYRICETLGEEHPAMENGLIIRLGTIADPKLSSNYNAYVTVDGIVERRSADLKARMNHVQSEIERIDRQSSAAKVVLERFVELDNVQRELQFYLEETNKLARSLKEFSSSLNAERSKLQQLNEELETRRGAAFTFFKRSEQSILTDISVTQSRQTKLVSDFESQKRQYQETKAKFDTTKLECDRLHAQLEKVDRGLAERIISAAEKARAPLVSELREIETKISDLRTSIVKEAKVLGTTCTKAYLAAKDIGQMDIVIVDEASMVLLPMIWFVSGLAKDRFVACGDFCQIPPIVQTSQQAVFDVLGHDVFAATGLDDPRSTDNRMTLLDTQYRMDKVICELISEPMYLGQLKTAVDARIAPKAPPPPYDGKLTIVDTSDLWPFESVNAFFSRYNLMHALLVRNFAWHLHRQGRIETNENLAICTPYAAQSRLIGKLLEGEGLSALVQVGTVHRFQGDERDAILLELPEGYGGARMIGQFLQGIPPKHVGARLMNVAVSRARHHLIVLANLTYLDRLLPSMSLLRGILFDMQETGRVVSGTDLLALRPIESDLRGIFDRVPLDLDARTMGIFNQSTFDAAIEADIANAKDSIVIFSGFVTPARVAKLGDLLRLKAANGVKVRCVTRPPKLNGTMELARSKNALDALERINCAVDCRARIHEKIVLIDKEIVWHGSLNVLSHTHRTDESMTRIANAGLAGVLAANMSKRRVSNDMALQTVGEAENPRCETCNSRSVYNEGRFGPYFYCEEECGWSVNLKTMTGQSQTRNQAPDPSIPKDGPACPECGGRTKLRNGSRGRFYSCVRYPDCRGTVNIGSKSKTRNRRKNGSRSEQHDTPP